MPAASPDTSRSPVLLIIMDGVGEGKDYEGNALKKAHTPHLDTLRKSFPFTTLKSHGNAVGLPENTQGGSEVGHFTMGAGRIVFQSLEAINRAIASGEFFKKSALIEACERVQKTEKAALHLIGMISDQGVHSDIRHLFALLQLAKNYGIAKTYIHAITDGRDVPEKSADTYIKILQQRIAELEMGPGSPTEAKIATIIGRYYAMDRDKNWDRTQKAYDLYTSSEGVQETDPLKAITNAYARNIETDYYIDAITLDEHGKIMDKDSVIFWNFRTDRTRQLTHCFTEEEPIGFTKKKTVHPFFVCMGDYSHVAPVLFPTPIVKNNLGHIIAQTGLSQLRIAETEKYAHVTYFFNNQIEEPNPNESRILIDSKKAPSYASCPEMSAREITNRLLTELDALDKNHYALIVLNFANGDLVGHSGDFNAAVQAAEVLDECIGRITEKTLQLGIHTLITGDHGNIEYMIYDEGPSKGEPCPSHTKNPVPCYLVSPSLAHATLRTHDAELKDIAPTVLSLLNIEKPHEMTGTSLIVSAPQPS